MSVTAVRVDKDFLSTMELKLHSGTDFTVTDERLADSENVNRPIIINETAAKALGWSAEQAVGKRLDFQGRASVIKGVAQDFHFSSMHRWLEDFTYRINMSVWVFILAGALALIITFLTIGVQVIRVALSSPVKSLRTE